MIKPAGRVGVVISAHCSSHNEGCAGGKVAGQISAGDDIFDRPVRVAELLTLLEPWATGAAAGDLAADDGAATSTLASTTAAACMGGGSLGIGEVLAVVRSSRLAEDRDLLASGITSRRYVQFLRQRSRELQRKQVSADKWAADSKEGCEEWAFLDADDTTLVNATTEAAARSAVGATLDAIEAVLAGRWRHAFVCARPPGHHNGCCELLEEIDKGGYVYACHGGCVLNETAVGIRHAQALTARESLSAATSKRRAGAASRSPPPPTAAASIPFGTGCKVAVVDIDVHFGDGTALCFYDDPSVRANLFL